jgi:hypothetical protein
LDGDWAKVARATDGNILASDGGDIRRHIRQQYIRLYHVAGFGIDGRRRES